ncbi:hypothetical protein C6501_19330 [Candidatus Poribacteria bacterium]|nr:MAG: hypothetical protein C6501_19330 [Candidatus Poribacteria bacterium]
MKTPAPFLRRILKVHIAFICLVCVPRVAFGIEPIGTIGQLPPEKHAFLTDQTILRVPYLGTNFQIVDRETGKIIGEFGNRPRGSDIVFSPNATHLAILNDSTQPKTTTVNIWDTEAREMISEWEAAVPIFENAAFSPTQPLLVNSYDNEIYLWNWQIEEFIGKMVGERRQWEKCYVKTVNGESVSKLCLTSTSAHEMLFTPDGKHLIVASKRPDIELWNVETRELVGHFEGHTGNWVDGLAISPDGTYLASYERESNFVYLWDIATRQLLWREPIHETGISDIVFSADSQHLYAANKNVYIWDVKSGQQIDSFGNDYFGLRQMILSPDGKTMLLQYGGSFWWGGVVVLWDTETNQKLKEFADYIGGIVRLSSDGETMISADSNFIKVWDIPSQQVRFVISAEHFYGFHTYKDVAISPDSKRIAYSNYPWIEVADLQNGNVKAQYQHHIGLLDHASFSSTDRWLAVVNEWGYLFLFDVSNPKEIHRVPLNFQLGRSNFYQVAFSENDEYMAASARTGKLDNSQYWILLWKREGENFEFQYKWETTEHSDSLHSTLAFASTEDGSTVLAAALKDLETRIWKILPQNAQLVNTLLPADAPIHFSPDKRYLFTNQDSEFQIWDWQTSRLIKYPSIPNCLGISQDGSILVSTDEIGRYLIWDAKNLFSSLPYPVEPKGKKLVTLGQIKRNQLLQNFPNPFNPETWIPFRLAEERDVTIRIYTPTGKLVRSLSIGIMSAGDYSSQPQAVHWDGRNDNGERVSG